jgi:glutamyl-tRNA synthetase
VTSLLRHDGGHFTTPTQFLDRNWSFFAKSLTRTPYVLQSKEDLQLGASESPLSALQTVATTLTLVPESHWNAATHRASLDSLPYTSKAFKKELYGYLRWALLAGASGPGAPQTMEILGRDETVRRLAEARESNGVGAKRYQGRIKLD